MQSQAVESRSEGALVARVPEVCVVDDDGKLADEVAELFIRSAAGPPESPFRVALSGGSTPRKLYGRLASPKCDKRVKWSRVEFYFGDERCVPPDHVDSNFKVANDTLFRPLGIKATQIFRMECEAGQSDPAEPAAHRYEETIRRQFKVAPPAWPRFDLILLGLGDDGHTASLFPGTSALHEKTRAVVASTSPRGVRHRLTFTAPLINHARCIIFMAAGVDKAQALHAVVEDDTADANRYPGKLIQPIEGRLLWYLDRAAASSLGATTRREMRRT